MLSAEYKNNPRMSQSKLKHILDGIEEFKWHLDNPTQETEAMRLGTAVHLLLLQPEREKFVVALEKMDGRTKRGKIFDLMFRMPHLFIPCLRRREIFGIEPTLYRPDTPDYEIAEDLLEKYGTALEHPDQYVLLSEENYKKAHDMAAAVRRNADAMQILDSCEAFEQEVYFTYLGIDFKAQLDGLGSDFVIDVKTTRCENKEHKIRVELLNRGHHFQGATYLQGTGKRHYYIIYVRNEPPYAVFPVKLSPDTLTEGRLLLDEACNIYKDCLKNNPDFVPNNKLRII